MATKVFEKVGDFVIVNGPGKYELERGIMDGKILTFTIQNNQVSHKNEEITVRTDDIGIISRYDDLWKISGALLTLHYKMMHCHSFDGSYSVPKRKGEISLYKWELKE